MKLIFYKPTSVVGRLIQLFTKAEYSHVALLIDDFHVFDVNWNHNAKIRHININSKYYDIYELNLTDKQEKLIKNKIKTLIQYDYDLSKAFDLNDNINQYTCYELINVLLYEIDYLDEVYDIFLPEELLDILERRR